MKNKQRLKIREAELKDIDSFFKLFRLCIEKQFVEYSPKVKTLFLKKYFSKKDIRDGLQKKTLDLLLAFVDGNIQGFLLALPPYGGVSYISWIAIRDEFQGKGLGSALLKEYEVFAKKKKVHKIHLGTSQRNVDFYKKNGWTLLGLVPDNYFGVDDWLFYKSIQKSKF